MDHLELPVLVAVLCVTSIVTGIASADPPRPGTEGNGLTENESATLWSRDADNYISRTAYEQRYDESRTAMHQLANGTDITFTRPPATAATWTRNDFEDLAAGGPETSIHPPHADLAEGVYITDAHATVFAVHPSTRGHLEVGATPLYIAPRGTLRGFVDYRVRIPNGSSSDNRTVEWSLQHHEIAAVRLIEDETTLVEQAGSHTPALTYHLRDSGRTTLTLEAEINVTLEKTVRIDRGNRSNGTENRTENRTETRTNVTVTHRQESLNVTDTIDVAIYDLSASAHYAEYPNGDTGVAIFQSRPWQGYTLTEDGRARVRGVWRFYTARDPNWDTLVQTRQTGRKTIESDAIPVYVHAYPSRIGPRAEPVHDGPDVIDTWGQDRPSPVGTIGENINIDIVNRSYSTTYGVAVRAGTIDRDALRVVGIVRGVNASIGALEQGSERQLRRSNLTVEVLNRSQSQATVRIELRDARTGAPIALGEGDRQYPIRRTPRNGYITIGEHRVETNATGVAIVTITDPGFYTTRYHPGSWLGHNPAYTSSSASIRWHPLGTVDGVFGLLISFGWLLLPFAVMYYAGKRLLWMLGPDELFQQQP